MAPRPLPVRPLGRALTIPNHAKVVESKEGASHRGMTLDQSASRLMQLPLELRQMIYRAAIGNSKMHMLLKKHKLGHIRCKASNARECPLECNLGPDNIWSPFAEPVEEPTDGDVLPLLLTCRQIYSEAIDAVYSSNCFSFSDLDCLRYFSCTILPHRWALVQTLDIEWCISWPIYDPIAQTLLVSRPALYPPHDEATWEATWRIISNMSNLKSLRVSLMYFDWFRDPGCEEGLLAPLRQVTLPRKFEVHLSWAGEEIKDAPFQLFRPDVRVPELGDGWI
ncbi:hypothetical protein N0V90_012388 [Kalmusia sp. IMI 367209]|nr:hypothetical protein N0V90_012388 [Kalmusia sp. IMI 367209]